MNYIESLKQTKIFSKRRCKERENDRRPKEGKYREEDKFKVRMREPKTKKKYKERIKFVLR